MGDEYAWKIAEGSTIKLKEYDPGDTLKHDEKKAKEELEELLQELSELQEELFAAQHHSILLVLQGMDTSGKDGTIRHVLSRVNPQGCTVSSFKQPTTEEVNHDFLWRIHKVAPEKGIIGVFNRSHYEDVLVVRVHKMIPEEAWSKRYKQINQFEKLLAQNNTLIVKFFLHISKEEQEKRLDARVQDKEKSWKVAVGDWRERNYWDEYQEAYEDALGKCSTAEAPWYIVPTNHKWYRNLAIAHTLVHMMRKYKDEWHTDLEARGQRELEALREYRASVK